MRASRIKNIIILLLLIVNAFLLAQVGIKAWRTGQGERETRERMVEVLARSGIEYLPDEVPGEMELTPVRMALTSAEERQELSAALGEDGRPDPGDLRAVPETEGAEKLPAGETITASTALARFLKALNDGGYVCSQVKDLYAGYAVSGVGTGSVTLAPAWFVETDAWPWRFAVDATDGTVTVVE